MYKAQPSTFNKHPLFDKPHLFFDKMVLLLFVEYLSQYVQFCSCMFSRRLMFAKEIFVTYSCIFTIHPGGKDFKIT